MRHFYKTLSRRALRRLAILVLIAMASSGVDEQPLVSRHSALAQEVQINQVQIKEVEIKEVQVREVQAQEVQLQIGAFFQRVLGGLRGKGAGEAATPAADADATVADATVTDETVADNTVADAPNAAREEQLEDGQEEQWKQLEVHFGQQFRPVVAGHLNLIQQTCQPTPDQAAKLAKQGKVALKAGVKAFVDFQKKMQTGRWDPSKDKQPDPQRIIVTELNTAARELLPREKYATLEEAVKRLEESRKRAALLCLVAKMDKDLYLSRDQRDRMLQVLDKNWDSAWQRNLQFYLQEQPGHYPNIPDEPILAVLGERQQAIWKQVQRVDLSNWGWGGFLGHFVINPAQEEPEDDEEQRRKEPGRGDDENRGDEENRGEKENKGGKEDRGEKNSNGKQQDKDNNREENNNNTRDKQEKNEDGNKPNAKAADGATTSADTADTADEVVVASIETFLNDQVDVPALAVDGDDFVVEFPEDLAGIGIPDEGVVMLPLDWGFCEEEQQLVAAQSQEVGSDDEEQEEGEEEEGLTPQQRAEAQAQAAFEVGPDHFDLWVYNMVGGRGEATKRIDNQLRLFVESLQRLFALTDEQTKRVEFYGRGDIVRFQQQVEQVRARFMEVRKDQQRFNNIWNDIGPLQQRMQTAFFDDHSLLAKSLANVLKPDQLERYEQWQAERRRFQHLAKIELIIAELETYMPMTAQQRVKVIQLVTDAGPTPRKSSQYDQILIMYLMSKVPDQEWLAVLDKRQFEVVNKLRQQGRQYGQMLRQNRIIDE